MYLLKSLAEKRKFEIAILWNTCDAADRRYSDAKTLYLESNERVCVTKTRVCVDNIVRNTHCLLYTYRFLHQKSSIKKY